MKNYVVLDLENPNARGNSICSIAIIEVKDNDIVKINTNKSSTPSTEWINMVKATTTKNKIKSFFTKNEREIYIERGKYSLEKELRKRKIIFSEFTNEVNIKKICENEQSIALN